MELKQLTYFYEASTCQCFSKAAKNLYISQQALSKAIANLEAELGVALFVRKSSGISLTNEGEYLLERCKVILPYIIETANGIHDMAEHHLSEIKISLIYAGFSFLPMKILADYNKQHPKYQFSFSEKGECDCEKDILSGAAHGAITTSPQTSDSLNVILLTREPLCLIVNDRHPLAEKTTIVPEDLAEINLSTLKELPISYQIFERNLMQSGVTLTLAHLVSDIFSGLELCRDSNIATLFASRLLEKFSYPNLRKIPLQDNFATWDIYFVFRKDSPHQQILYHFADYLKEKLA